MQSKEVVKIPLAKIFMVNFIALTLGFLINWGLFPIVLGLALGISVVNSIIRKKLTLSKCIYFFAACIYILAGVLMFFTDLNHFSYFGVFAIMVLILGTLSMLLGNLLRDTKWDKGAANHKEG